MAAIFLGTKFILANFVVGILVNIPAKLFLNLTTGYSEDGVLKFLFQVYEGHFYVRGTVDLK